MSSTSGPSSSLSARLPHFQTSLESFTSSTSSFLVLNTVPSHTPPSSKPPSTLHVLDSSFNPPTRAHLRIALSALRSSAPNPQRLLLLLATQNADKAPKPAAFEQRVAMMTLLAQDILDEYSNASSDHAADDALAVDVGVTKKPFFHDKALCIEESGYYSDAKTREQPQQVHLLGFDSLVRLLDTKYYGPEHTLAPVEALFGRHRIRVTRRTEEGDKYGTVKEQDRLRKALEEGERESEGGKREWAQKIEMVDGEGEAVSSTKARISANVGDWPDVERLVGRRVRQWVERENLYKESTAKG
ncbi:MAG: hypothetical protein LQ346_007025 [Caloplaca aetnensis]|nr:MAG: hypothetical protein LQ346_007025 [Caloplaca aetnensis]